MADAIYSDGDYDFAEVKDAMNKDFASEKELCEYIENNISSFVSDCLGLKLKYYKREFPVSENLRRIKNNRRLDFLIETECGKKIGIECKNPFYKCELSNAIGQCLTYLAMFEQYGTPLTSIVILSTKIDHILPLVISRFNLPIAFIAFDKTKFLTYKGCTNGQ